MKRMLLTMAVVLCLVTAPMRSHAGIITTTILGTSMGILAGSVAMALTHDPGDHRSYVGIGAGVGFAAGLILGISGAVESNDSKSFILNYYQNRSYRDNVYGLVFRLPLQ
jgi:FtsH-binding integral membrane protein